MLYLDDFSSEQDFSKSTLLICGAGVSLVEDLYEVSKTDYIMGINHHSLILKPDFIVAMDRHTMKLLGKYRGILMAKHEKADVHIGTCPSFGFSGACGVWVADALGFKEIFLAGFDCYLFKERSYWHEGIHFEKPHLHTTEEQQLKIWGQVKCALKNPQNIYVLSGMLGRVFRERHQ